MIALRPNDAVVEVSLEMSVLTGMEPSSVRDLLAEKGWSQEGAGFRAWEAEFSGDARLWTVRAEADISAVCEEE
jgi:hypothetical protein